MDKNKLILSRISSRLLEEEDAKSYRVSLVKRKCTNTMNIVIEKYNDNGNSFRVFNRPVNELMGLPEFQE